MTFDREELLAALVNASPALANNFTIPGLDHFWFDGDFVYAYDGGLGVRVAFKSELGCGLPGKVLLDLLKTSALKQVDMEFDKKDVVLKMGKSKVKLSSLGSDCSAWAFPSPSKKVFDKALGILPLTEAVMEAITRVSFARMSGKPKRVIENGVTVIPQRGVVEFYATDSASIARAVVEEDVDKDLPSFILPWPFVDQLLELVEPGASLHVLDDCLMVVGKGVLVCSHTLELGENNGALPTTISPYVRDEGDVVVDIPGGLQAVLDRAMILSGQKETLVSLSVEGKLLIVEGKYGLGSLYEELPIKGKLSEVSTDFPAHLVRRGLSQAKNILLSTRAMVLDDGSDFVYVLAAKHTPQDVSKVKRGKAEEEVEEEVEKIEKPVRRKLRSSLDDEIPF